MTAGNVAKISIGTANFGLPYGVANHSGKISEAELSSILSFAFDKGIKDLDTAIAYGESESLLGKAGIQDWRVVTKLPPLPEGIKDGAQWVEESITASLGRLKISTLHGALLHHPQDLLGPQGAQIYSAFLRCKEKGMIRNFGISIYDPKELDAIMPFYPADIVQAPMNALDQRLIQSGWLRRLHNQGCEIQIRSVFLQGLLLMGQKNRPLKFNRWESTWNHWHGWLEGESCSALEASLHSVMAHQEINKIVLGIDSVHHLDEILKACDSPSHVPPSSLICNDIDLINPSRWGDL